MKWPASAAGAPPSSATAAVSAFAIRAGPVLSGVRRYRNSCGIKLVWQAPFGHQESICRDKEWGMVMGASPAHSLPAWRLLPPCLYADLKCDHQHRVHQDRSIINSNVT